MIERKVVYKNLSLPEALELQASNIRNGKVPFSGIYTGRGEPKFRFLGRYIEDDKEYFTKEDSFYLDGVPIPRSVQTVQELKALCANGIHPWVVLPASGRVDCYLEPTEGLVRQMRFGLVYDSRESAEHVRDVLKNFS